MDSIHYDGYTSYSESSTPRTPSPRTDDMHFPHHPKHLDEPVRNIFDQHADDPAVRVHDVHPEPHYWPAQSHPFAFNNNNNSRGSLLQELYDHEVDHHQHPSPDGYPLEQPTEPSFTGETGWAHVEQQQQQQQQQLQHTARPHDYHMIRRATFPYVRHDREDGPLIPQYQYIPQQQQHQHEGLMHPYPSRQDALYGDIPLSSEPGSLQGDFMPSLSNSPHSSYHEFDDTNIKLEDTPMMLPSQAAFYSRPSSSSGCHPMSMSYLSPHTGLPVQHTDDAASKETQYLRRRCFNCHTTEPPSWRRSTLNPGKIVCNKCGLYERTHLRPRPLRFDELRAGNKARKQSKGTVSPKSKMAMVKKEPREYGLARRSSVSSSASSVHSGSGASDWDDSVSIYSSGSAPSTSFNSPNVVAFPLARDSQSPPRDGGIRLPNTPLSDIASLQAQQQQAQTSGGIPPHSPRKAHTSPGYFSPPMSASNLGNMQAHAQHEFFRRGSQEWTGVPELEVANATLLASPLATSVAS